MLRYVGITGFMTHDEATAATYEFARAGLAQLGYRLMVGVLASSKTLAGGQNKWPGRYPYLRAISEIWPDSAQTLNLIHYATDEASTLGTQLERLAELSGPRLGGFQLNVPWPDPAQLLGLAPYSIVLQLGRGALVRHNFGPRPIADHLERYAGLLSAVLLDASGGTGEALDPAAMAPILEELVRRQVPFGLGVAGGLSAESMHLVEPCVAVCPRLSIDAEGRLRDTDDRLDLGAVEAYLGAAANLFRETLQ